MQTLTQSPIVYPAQLTRALSDLHGVKPWRGLMRSMITIPFLLLCLFMALQTQSIGLFLLAAIVGGIIKGSMVISTHDCIHHTFTGWAWFDELVPRLVSYPLLWPHGLYVQLHKIHHKMNGQNIDDPERKQWTQEEYEKASFLGKFAFKNQLFLAVFVYGGFGFMFAHVFQGLKFSKRSKAVKRALIQDAAAIILINGTMYFLMAQNNLFWKYLLFYLFLERIGGGIMQFRSYIEHYGLWGKHANYFETQIFTCRNINTNELVSLYFNRLNFHSVHHAFPTVPFYNLPEAHRRLCNLYGEKEIPLIEHKGYIKTAFELAKNPKYIHLSTV